MHESRQDFGQSNVAQVASAADVIADRSPFVCRWLFGPWFDTAMFFAPVFLAPLLLWCSNSVSGPILFSFIILQGFGLAPFHLGTTWYHLSDSKLRSHFFRNKTGLLLMSVATALVIAACIACNICNPLLLTGIYMLWTVQHIAKQNIGILRLFHNPGLGDEAIVGRNVEARAIYSAVWLYSLIFLTRFANPGSLQYMLGCAAVAVSAIDLLTALHAYFSELRFEHKRGRSINLPAQAFWLLSMTVLAPLAFVVKDFNQAVLIPLVVHWFQYIGLNAYLIKNKRGQNPTEGSRHFALFLGAGFALMAIFLVIGTLVARTSCHGHPILYGVLFGVGIVHYIQDAFLWRFREPVLRQELLAYLKP